MEFLTEQIKYSAKVKKIYAELKEKSKKQEKVYKIRAETNPNRKDTFINHNTMKTYKACVSVENLERLIDFSKEYTSPKLFSEKFNIPLSLAKYILKDTNNLVMRMKRVERILKEKEVV